MALRILPATICLLLALSSHATAQQSSTEDTAFADVQKHFAEAHNHKDVDAMAAAFTENGVRVTPSGIFQGRDAIRRNLQDAVRSLLVVPDVGFGLSYPVFSRPRLS